MSMRKLSVVEGGEPAGAAEALTLRVAVATQDVKAVNAHFGSAKKFAVYEVTPTASRFIEAVGFDETSDESGTHNAEIDKIGPKVAAIAGCNLLFCLAIGGPAAAKVVSAKIHPVKLSQPETIETVIAKVQGMMTGDPPPWLRKAMSAKRERSMQFLDDED
ncbi:MAG TPA: nitrogen fixation protein NifX [Polyangiaceae bacterium]|nr:nitrogen fixation protein NifX [Polyangiaceae bacterium]